MNYDIKKMTALEFVEKSIDGVPEEVCVLRTAERRKAKVVTVSDEFKHYANSFSDVRIINIKELYYSLTPIFIPNRIITVRILKRGMNHNEGIGYIEGVKIVVMDGAKYINQTVNVRVCSMLQLESGNLVFATLNESPKEFEEEKKGMDNGDQRT